MRSMARLAMVVVLAAATLLPAVTPAAGPATGGEDTRVCPGCGEEIPATSTFCPSCHRYLPDAKVKTEYQERTGAKERKPVREPARRWLAGNVVGGYMGGTESATASGVWATLGLRPTDLLVLGPGVGYQIYPNGGSMPIYFGLRRYLSRTTYPPLIYFRTGYNKGWLKDAGFPFTGEEDPSGMFVGAGGGLDFLTPDGVGLTMELGGRAEITNKFYVLVYPGGIFSPVQKVQMTLLLARFAFGASF
jgi:hypothetical protein